MKYPTLKIRCNAKAFICLIALFSLSLGSNLLFAGQEDSYEQEADTVADTIMRPAPIIRSDATLKSQSLKSEQRQSALKLRAPVQQKANISTQPEIQQR